MKESDLYPLLKQFLESQGYSVKGEILDCDVVAVRENEAPVAVELKLTLNLDVLLQAVQRLSLTPTVYIGIPKNCKAFKRKRRAVIKLMRMLGLGLILIEPDRRTGAVEVLFDPGPYKPRISKHRQERLLGEFVQRVGDPNPGGMTRRRGILTAYRQRALSIGLHLEAQGASKASDVASALAEPRAREILYRNVYGWFDRVTQGVYDLSPRGRREIATWTD